MKTQGRSSRQNPSGMPIAKYRHFLDVNPVSLPDRTWPDNRILKAPRWLSTDLRDGNQALIEPMDPARKKLMFELLIELGLKEIEIGFPAASAADLEFCRTLVEEGLVPEDVTISVLTQSRQEIIHKTVDALEGLPRAVVHLYNATSPVFRRVVFHNDKEATKQLAVTGTQELVAYMEKTLGDDVVAGFEYSPEIFVDTELDFALEVCEAVMDVWQPGPDREIVINLPTTVERCTPNVYADQIEYMSRNLSRREHVVLSAHNHNDRGTGIATAELAMLAGVDRVEGCLFGQGERTGNVDLVTLGMNLYSQGVDPQIDFSDMDRIRRTVEYCTGMPVPARQPYAGDLVYTAFSGSHQDAIKKGLEDLEARGRAQGRTIHEVDWLAPYLPIDPHDVGRTYEAVIRVNSQSGKGGMAYLMKSDHHLDLPRRLQMEFSRVVQDRADASGREISSEELWRLFHDEYLERAEPIGALDFTVGAARGLTSVDATIGFNGRDERINGEGNGPLSAFIDALGQVGLTVKVLDYTEHALTSGGDAYAAAYVEVEVGRGDDAVVLWGVGIDPDITTATLKAAVSAVNRA